VKEFRKSANIWWSYGQELDVLFFWLTVYIVHQHPTRPLCSGFRHDLLPLDQVTCFKVIVVSDCWYSCVRITKMIILIYRVCHKNPVYIFCNFGHTKEIKISQSLLSLKSSRIKFIHCSWIFYVKISEVYDVVNCITTGMTSLQILTGCSKINFLRNVYFGFLTFSELTILHHFVSFFYQMTLVYVI